MRNFLFAILVSVSGCATNSTGAASHPTNVAHVRLEIWSAMQAQSPERTISAMGKTTDVRAVVYTKSKAGARQEETWVRDTSGWKLDHSVAVEGQATSNAL
jgi:hypothetical protein